MEWLVQMPNSKSGITFTSKRQQPYTIWWYGEVLRFCFDEYDAWRRWKALNE